MRKGWYILLMMVAMVGCREYKVSDDPTLRLTFSKDTLSFDTVFTEQGSATLQLMVYNQNRNALVINHIDGLTDSSAFHINVDGEQKLSRLRDIQLNGGDSIYVFVRVDINPNASNSPVLVSDILSFHLQSGTTQSVVLEAYGQDVTRLRGDDGRLVLNGYTFTAEKPYLLRDTIIINGDLTIEAGTRLYMHRDASLYALGNVSANGSLTEPIIIRGDRLDRLFDSVPYNYASGGWSGIYLQTDEAGKQYNLSYVDILSGNVGLYCYSSRTDNLPMLRMDGCRIHNHALYGLVLIHTDALVTNTEISNCASYCVYCSGGHQRFIHSTIASYYGYTNIRIHSTGKEAVSAVYINNLSKLQPQTNCEFYNSIITGYLRNQIMVATPFDQYYPGAFVGNYLKTDTLAFPNARKNTYWQSGDTTEVFRNTFYRYKEYNYYDFRLDSLSPAIGIADSLTAVDYGKDRLGVPRTMCKPDAGCYQHSDE